MDRIAFSAHAERRSNQRGIRHNIVELLLDFGTSVINREGCEVIFMDKKARCAAKKALGKKYAQLERALDAYLVVGSDGTLITCGHRTRRIHA